MKMMKKMMTALAVTAAASISVATMGISASAADEPPYTAYLCFQAGATSTWDASDAGQTAVTINNDGTYSVSYTIQEGGGSATIECMILTTDINAYAFAPEGASAPSDGSSLPDGCTASITIDSIVVEQIAGSSYTMDYAGPSDGALRLNDDGSTIRVNIYNIWQQPNVADISTSPDGGLAEGDTVVVNFTVSGIEAGNGEDTPGDNTSNTDDTNSSSDNTNSGSNDTTTGGSNSDSSNTDGSSNGSSDTTGNSNDGSDNTNNGSSNSGTSGSSGSSNSGGASGSSNSGSGSTQNNATTSETGDFGIAAVALGAVAAAALGVGAFTVTRKKK